MEKLFCPKQDGSFVNSLCWHTFAENSVFSFTNTKTWASGVTRGVVGGRGRRRELFGRRRSLAAPDSIVATFQIFRGTVFRKENVNTRKFRILIRMHVDFSFYEKLGG